MAEKLKSKIMSGENITRAEALSLAKAPLEELCAAADEIRQAFCGSGFDICTIINGKSGRCSENCKFCAQSSAYNTGIEEYPLLDDETIIKAAKHNAERGILRFSIVTSGKRLSDADVDRVCRIVRGIKAECSISVCVSLGLLNEEQFGRLREAGVSRVHNNLETSRRFFPQICTTHTYDEKIAAIKAAQAAGLSVCSGGIAGLGETLEDLIDMAIEIRELGVRSVPINMLNPIKDTPLENNERLTNDDMRRICAIYRFINPSAAIRLAGGRIQLGDNGRACFKSGANAAISGDMLTTTGATIAKDMELLKELDYKAVMLDE